MLVIQAAKMYLSLQDFWQTKYLIKRKYKLCIFCGFRDKNFLFDFLYVRQCCYQQSQQYTVLSVIIRRRFALVV